MKVHLKWQVTQVKYCHVISGNGNTISGRDRVIHESQTELKKELCGALLCCPQEKQKQNKLRRERGKNLKIKAKQNETMRNQVDEFTRQKFKQILLEIMLTFKLLDKIWTKPTWEINVFVAHANTVLITNLFFLRALSVISIITAQHCPQCKLFAKSLKRCNLNEDRELMAMEILLAQARPGGTSAGVVMSMSISRRGLWSKLFLHSNRKHRWGHTFLQHR